MDVLVIVGGTPATEPLLARANHHLAGDAADAMSDTIAGLRAHSPPVDETANRRQRSQAVPLLDSGHSMGILTRSELLDCRAAWRNR